MLKKSGLDSPSWRTRAYVDLVSAGAVGPELSTINKLAGDTEQNKPVIIVIIISIMIKCPTEDAE